MDLRHAIEKIRPSVVQITLTADGLSESAIATLGGHGRMFSRPIGSGFFAASTGAVVTAKHVVDALPEWEDRCRRLGATHIHTGIGIAHLMPGGKRGVFTVVGYTVIATDVSHDLAVLLPQRNPFTGVAYATINGDRVPLACDIACLDTTRPQEGLPVGCSGYPLMNIALVTNSGIVASSWTVDLGQFASSAPHELPDRYLADMQINGGNSGGPVYSAVDSSVIGMAVASRLAPGVEAVPCRVEDAGLAVIVPSAYVAELLDANGIAWKAASLAQLKM
jgi:S1-C subfamily serine protease